MCPHCVAQARKMADPPHVRATNTPRYAGKLKTAFDFATDLTRLIDEDIKKLKDNPKNSLSDIQNFSVMKWIDQRPKTLIEVFSVLCNINEMSTSRDYAQMEFAHEIIYSCRKDNLILPLSLTKNTVLQSVMHSKQTVQVECALTPCGSYGHYYIGQNCHKKTK